MGKTVSAEKLYMHPKYNKNHDWDFCLIELTAALEFDCKVKPIGPVSIQYLIRNSFFYAINNK